MNLVQNVSDLDESVFQENIDVIRRTVGNFFIAYKSEGIEEQYRALDELLQSEVSANLIEEIVLKSVDKNTVAVILNYAINPALGYGQRSHQMKLLNLCAGYHPALNRTHLTNLIIDMMRKVKMIIYKTFAMSLSQN